MSELKSEIQSLSEAFAPANRVLCRRNSVVRVSEYPIAARRRDPEESRDGFHRSQRAASGTRRDENPLPAEIRIWVSLRQFTSAIGLSVGTSIALAIATVSGGLGKYLGVAIVATLLHTTGPWDS